MTVASEAEAYLDELPFSVEAAPTPTPPQVETPRDTRPRSPRHAEGIIDHMNPRTVFRDIYCREVIEFMDQGYSFTAWCGHMGIPISVAKAWRREHENFELAVQVGKGKRLIRWEGMAMDVAERGSGGPGAASIITFGLRNMGDDDWADVQRKEITGKDGGPMKIVFDRGDSSL